jgi:hypothetical protein
VRLRKATKRIPVVVSAFALAGLLTCAPTAGALPGVAGMNNELDYLDDLASATDVSGVSETEAIEMGYLVCLIQQMGGGAPAGYATVLMVANRHLCDFLPPLPVSQQSGAGNYDAVNDANQALHDQFGRTLVDDQDGLGNDDDLDGRTNAGDRAPTDDDFE